jgi:hypothetical protein
MTKALFFASEVDVTANNELLSSLLLLRIWGFGLSIRCHVWEN